MDLQTYGRHLAEVVAERSLHAIRGTNIDALRRVITGRPLRPTPAVQVATAIGAFAVGAALGAGLTALYTPTTGAQLRKLMSLRARGARKRARQTVRTQLHDARSSIAHGVEQVSTAVGLRSPSPRPRTVKRKASTVAAKQTSQSNGHGKRPASHSRVNHA